MHGPGPAQRHCMTSIRNTNYYEMGLVHPCNRGTFHTQMYTNYEDGLEAIDKAGNVFAPEGPGLGVEFDWDWIEKHETARIKFD
jgi:L-alanine-DL-glutamate epimerase-like enolase superfamily enzyme